MWIARYELSNLPKSFLGPCKKLGSFTSKAHT